jgi:nucleoside-diphosphate-sugar epimerase
MKILVLGSTGYIGRKLLVALHAAPWADVTGASRTSVASSSQQEKWIRADTCDVTALTEALKGFDAVVNCVAGDGRSISEGARALSNAASIAGCRRIIHMSTMSVYGNAEGSITEDFPLNHPSDWYGDAKREAESHMKTFRGETVILRPGCVFGPGSEQWVGRPARWLKSGRLGDLGASGDGWSNLVHVDDVCQAIVAALRLQTMAGQAAVFNLAAPDSPRGNRYFIDLGIAIGETPVRRISARQIRLDSLLAGPPLKVAEKLLKYAKLSRLHLPEARSPSLTRLLAQQIRLNPDRASNDLGVVWTPYSEGLTSSSSWIKSRKI